MVFLGCSHWECALEALDAATEALDLIKTLEDLLAVPPPKRWKFSHVRHLGDKCFWVSLCLAQDLPWEAIMLHSVAGKLRHRGYQLTSPTAAINGFQAALQCTAKRFHESLQAAQEASTLRSCGKPTLWNVICRQVYERLRSYEVSSRFIYFHVSSLWVTLVIQNVGLHQTLHNCTMIGGSQKDDTENTCHTCIDAYYINHANG